ncbi:glutaredoxin [Pseudomonas saudimassiliensis]|uniref:Glutaredoxin n=1 Tax=Pseudomonas saudimassiliensis TaxID=1461581 RepID=A0A078M7V7_9PSED|nr:glutaredoxin [Pseudomonas saudimassiliensis]CEA03513.1 glutaredoxin [Pseudomonas saudimassiliensis]CEF26214.1 glutaredoxin [Pseudomonas saudimassiliensis]
MNDSENHVYHKEGCPYAAKAIELLDKQGVSYRVHVFADPTEERLFKEEHGVQTTPQVFLEGERIGGYDELAAHFGQ